MSTDTSLRNNIWKWLALAILAVLSVYVAFPLEKKIRLGLDLAGGSSFTLGVDEEKLRATFIAENQSLATDEAALDKKIADTLNGCDARIIQVVRRRIDGMGVNEPLIQGAKGHRLVVQLPGIEDAKRAAARKSLQSAAFLEFRLVHPRNDDLVAKLLATDIAPAGYEKAGSGYQRSANYNEVAGQPGYAARLSNFHVPDPRYAFMLSKNDNGTYSPAFVSRHTNLTGESLTSASVERDPNTGKLAIAFQLDAEGGNKFAALTRAYMPGGSKNPSPRGRQLAIILDDTLVSAPAIQSEIGSHGQITGSFTAAEAQQLANDLNAGALPAPLKILAESSVAPTVGADAIHAGIIAAGLGFCLVALFMFFYYWFSGLVADIALFLDIALLPSALVIAANILGVFTSDASMGGTGSLALPVITMPGIAGMVLSLGMAVDANVLIFERIREEFQNGASAGTALKNGYSNAFSAIFDSNLTTIITGMILFIVGTGPIRGYAITLTAGVIISMFTALIVTRLVFVRVVKQDRVKPFRMLQVFKKPHFDFVRLGKITVAVSCVVIIATVGLFFFRAFRTPARVLAVDLTGGTALTYSYAKEYTPDVSKIRKALDTFDNATVIQVQSSLNGMGDTLLVKTGNTTETHGDVSSKVITLLDKAIPQAQFKQMNMEEVGSVVGSDLKEAGTKAVIFSLIAILIYVAFRFEFGFALGGVVALAHDAFITLGLFSLCGRQVSLIVVTALLTIVGYSINDTIVVFDRVREDLRKDARTPFRELCNNAINQTLSRTVITSMTTIFAVLALFTFGDGSIFDFALTMLIGVISGTYSTLFVATPVMMWWYRGRRPQFKSEESIRK